MSPPTSERRPGYQPERRPESAPTKKRTQAQDSASAPPFPMALQWARALIERAHGPLPTYGSPEWDALEDGPEKVAATVVAAEAWRTYWDPAERGLRLRIELDFRPRLRGRGALDTRGRRHGPPHRPAAELHGAVRAARGARGEGACGRTPPPARTARR